MYSLAEGFGARSDKIEDLERIGDVLGRALVPPGPSFVIIDRES
jgi:benzoylformate decarboxylase